MLARNITREQLEGAAREVGVRLNELRPKGKGFLFTLRPEPWTGKGKAGGKAKFYRKGFMAHAPWRKNGEPNTVSALCWHGHRDFFRALFKSAPEGKIQTRETRGSVQGGWYTAENFEREFPKTDRNIGSMMYPMRASEACWCREQGREDRGVEFGTLQPNGQLTNVRTIKHADIKACPFFILVPDHYEPSGKCKCHDADERARMIREWEYTEEDFRKAGVV